MVPRAVGRAVIGDRRLDDARNLAPHSPGMDDAPQVLTKFSVTRPDDGTGIVGSTIQDVPRHITDRVADLKWHWHKALAVPVSGANAISIASLPIS